MSTPGSIAYKLAFEISPIILVGGVIPGGMLPIITFTQAIDFVAGILSGSDVTDLDEFFAHFQPLSGGTLIDNQIGTYPFANQAVAANAIIAQPLMLSMLMICPARGELGYPLKLATMIALQAVLSQHNAAGGTYSVVTPSFFYTNGIMTGMRDISSQRSKQPQTEWQLDFAFPLLTLEQATSVQSALMQKITNGTQIDGAPAWSNPANVVGNPNPAVTPSVVPAAADLPGASTAPFTTGVSSLPVGATT